jgi:hypothetical protein
MHTTFSTGVSQRLINTVSTVKFKVLTAMFWKLWVLQDVMLCCWVCGYVEGLQFHKGHAVAQLVEAQRYKSEGRGFDSR